VYVDYAPVVVAHGRALVEVDDLSVMVRAYVHRREELQHPVGAIGRRPLNRRLPPPAPEERDRRADNGQWDGQVRSQGAVRRRRRQRDRYHDPSSRFIML
jgi:hypothetical protein